MDPLFYLKRNNLRRDIVNQINLLENIQKLIIARRRRYQQRVRRRNSLMLSFYMQQMLSLDTSLINILPQSLEKYLNKTNQVQKPPSTTIEKNEISETSQDNVEHSTLNSIKLNIGQIQNSNNLLGDDKTKEFHEHDWLAAFRMCNQSFEWLCIQLSDGLKPTSINSTSLKKRIALALFAFATGDDVNSIAKLFNVTGETVCKCMKRFAKEFMRKFGNTLIALPKGQEEFSDISIGFQRASLMPPLVVGVLGSCNIRFQTPSGKSLNATVQALIDDKALFRKVQFNTKDFDIMMTEPNEISKLPKQYLDGSEMPSFVIDSSRDCNLSPWCMQPYENPTEMHQVNFNESCKILFDIKDKAFMRLLSRWKILSRKVNIDAKTMKLIIPTCCALHNFLEEQNEKFFEEWSISKSMFTNQVKPIQRRFTSLSNIQEAINIRNNVASIISLTKEG